MSTASTSSSATKTTTSSSNNSTNDNDQSMSSALSATSSASSSSSSSTTTATNTTTTATMSNAKTNLIINYLPQTMSDENFRVMFAKYGDIRSAKIIRKKNSGYSYGFGFVEYFRQEDADMAIKNLNGIIINNKKIKVSHARPSSDDIKNANIYVTNLPSTYTEHDVRELFAECGDIIQCRLIGNRSGTAFILFNLNEQAKNAIDQFDNKLVPGTNCRIKVKFASSEQNKKMNESNNFNHNNNNNNNNINLTPSMAKHQKRYQSSNNNHSNNLANQRLASGPMRNTSHHNRYNPLAQFHVQQAPMMDDPSMIYSDRNHHHSSHHNPYGSIKVEEDSSQYYASNNPDMFSTSGNGGGNYNNGGQLDPSSSGGNNGSNEYILFVYNIGPETDEYNLGKLFSYYGQVLRVNVIRKGGPQNSGEGKGYGFVTMKFYQEAVNAIANLNGYKFVSNRPLQVSFKKIN